MRYRLLLCLTASLIVTGMVSTSAQTESPSHSSASQPQTGVVYAGETMVYLKPLAPFSAHISDEWRLNDGTIITNKADVVIRDGQGRVYRELQIPAAGEAQTETEIRIDDPTRHIEFLGHPKVKNCIMLPFQPITGVHRPTMADAKDVHDATLEDLGTVNMSGVVAKGVRINRVLAVGSIGNDRNLTLTVENWYSPELQLDMQIMNSDPRTGTRTRSVTDLSLGEPDPKYFEPPTGLAVVDMREQIAKDKASAVEAEPLK